MIEKLFFMLGKQAATISKIPNVKVPSSLSKDILELENDGLVSNQYLRSLIYRSRNKEQLGRILHYLDHNNTNNLTQSQWSELRSLIFDRFKDMKLAELLSHLDLIIMHLF